MKNLYAILIILTLLISSINSLGQTRKQSVDIREVLIESAKRGDKEFPDGKDVLLVHFSYLGKLHTKDGVIFVADMRSALNHMPAPRGINSIMFFNRRYQFLGKQDFAASMPLWCEGGKLFLFGDLDGFSEIGQGNVIDLTKGYKNMRIYHQKRYASSGGIDDGELD
jgi:hypothetical protein